MCRKSEHESILAFSLPRGASLALCLLVLLFGVAFAAAAEKSTGSSPTTEEPSMQPTMRGIIAQYVPIGYSIEGPLRVLSATPQAIKFFTYSETKPLVLVLTGVQVHVRDAQNKELTLADLVQGASAFVSRSPDKKIVFVFVVPKKGKENRDDL